MARQLVLIEATPNLPIARRYVEAARRGIPAARAALRNATPTPHVAEEAS